MDPEPDNADPTTTPISSSTIETIAIATTNTTNSVNEDLLTDEHKDNNTIDSRETAGTTKEHKHHHDEDGTKHHHHHHHHHHDEDGKDSKHKHHHHDHPDGIDGTNDEHHHHHHHHHDDPNDKDKVHHHHHHHKHSKAEQPQPQLANAAQSNISSSEEQKTVDIVATTTTTTTTEIPPHIEPSTNSTPSTTSPSTIAPSISSSSPSTLAESSAPTIDTVTPSSSSSAPPATSSDPSNESPTIPAPNITIATTPSTLDVPTTTTIVVTNEALPTAPKTVQTTINITTEITPPPENFLLATSSSMPSSALTSPAVIPGISIPLSGDVIPPPQQVPMSALALNEQRSTASSDINTTEDQMSDKPESQRASQSRVLSKKEWRQSMFLEPPMPAEHKKDRLRHHAKLAHKKNTLGETIYKGHPSWLLMRDIQTGLYTNIRNMATGQVEHPDLYFTPAVTVLPISNNSTITFKFKDYCPLAFYKLREHFGINHVDYITSLCQNWNEVGTPGKSGSLFFFSLDNQYVLKTIPKREAKLLRSLLPAYYEYMTNHSDSLITRFMGLHRIKPHKGRQVRFLVMGNLFNSNLKVHQRFDLKGSTVGRELLPAERAKKNPTFKDLDFRRLNRRIHLGPNRDLFLRQLQLDCTFLSSLHVMDYSLLVGIHFSQSNVAGGDESSSEDESEDEARSPPLNRSMGTLPPLIPDEETPPPNQALSCFEREEGGIRARGPDGTVMDEYYYIGVIDILMLYTARKQIEHAAKRIFHPRGEISSVDPQDFATRFMKFMTEIVD